MQVNIDNLLGTIKTLTSGRAIIDFNHPLAGRTLIYKIKINKEITQPKIKLDSLLSFYIKDFKTEIKNSTLTIKANLQEDLKKLVIEKIKALIPEFKEIVILKE